MNIYDEVKAHAPFLSDEQAEKFSAYLEMLTEWNATRCNLTAITDPTEIIKKHFLDSVLPERLIPRGASCVDVGTGAGFPGVPLMIVRPDIKLTLIDSLQKRIDFLEALKAKLGLDARCIHARAEDAGRDAELREKFDIALTRAVSQTNVLLEWTSPLLKVGGTSLMYKSVTAQEELKECKNALSVLGMEAGVEHFEAEWGERCVICAKKNKKTPAAYPRRAGEAKRRPL